MTTFVGYCTVIIAMKRQDVGKKFPTSKNNNLNKVHSIRRLRNQSKIWSLSCWGASQVVMLLADKW